MGIDWFRVRVKRDAPPDLLDRLVEQQAVAFQSMDYFWNFYSGSYSDRTRYALQQRLHFKSYRAACDALKDLLEFPKWDEDRVYEKDIPDLSGCWRVYPITHNPIFPPLWRMRAHKTFLPHQLGAQLSEWRAWAEQVARGKHDDYLRELHMYTTSCFMRDHWSALRAVAIESLTQTGNWVQKPALTEIREQILRLPEPAVAEVRVDPLDRECPEQKSFDACYRVLFEDVRRLIGRTRDWDSNVRGDWKIRYDESDYHLTLEEFRNQARDDWLQQFFQWADRCLSYGFGLYLDY